jgi:hypothetical protein
MAPFQYDSIANSPSAHVGTFKRHADRMMVDGGE